MTSKERIRAAVAHQRTDCIPANFECVPATMQRLMDFFGYKDADQVKERMGSDIRDVQPRYIGPERKEYTDTDGCRVWHGYWGEGSKVHWTGISYESVPFYFPLDECNTIEDLKNYNWPRTEWFDYESVKAQCAKYKDKAITMGIPARFSSLRICAVPKNS